MLPKIVSALPPLAAALIATRFAWVVATLARALPEGPWPVARFGLVAAVVCLAPGLALLRALHPLDRTSAGLADGPLFVLSTSLAASGLAAWALYFCGLYARGAALAALALFALAGAWGAAPLLSRRALRSAAARLRAIPPGAWIAPLVLAVFLEGVFESALGQPFVAWDAVVTWDKWAADAGARAGFGAQLVGGYPQLLPAIRSLFYKAAATPAGAVLPAEQLLLHGFDAVFPAILALSIFALGRRHRFPALLAFALLAACDPFFANFASGEADVPLAAFAAATAALLPPLAEARGGGRALAPLALLFFATVFAKGTGVVLAAGLVAFAAMRGGRPALRRSLAAAAVALALAALFLAHQLWLSAHSAAREASPFLVALPLHAAHVRLFSPDFAHLAAMLRRLVAHRVSPPVAPPAVALGILGAGLAAAFARRRTRIAALALLALLAFWFLTASYDWRNAFPALAFGSVVLSAAAAPFSREGLRDPRNRRIVLYAIVAKGALLCALSTAAILGAERSDAIETFCRPLVVRWRAPKAACLPPERRHMALRPAGDIRNILLDAPWAARAEHVWTGDPLYRLLAPKGCYAIQANAWRDAKPGDLFVATAALPRPPEGFVLIAELRRTPGYHALWMFRPDLAPGLVLEIPAPEGDAPPLRELFGEAAAGDPFAAYLAPVRDGAALRLPTPGAEQ
jgi:hypothetical protein